MSMVLVLWALEWIRSELDSSHASSSSSLHAPQGGSRRIPAVFFHGDPLRVGGLRKGSFKRFRTACALVDQ